MKQLTELELKHNVEQLSFFRELGALTPDDAVIVEIGSYVGAIANQFVGGNRKIFSIDPWQADGVYDINDEFGQYSLIEDAELNRGGIDQIYKTWMRNAGNDLFINLFPIKGFSQDIAEFFNLPIDLLYIDGCHKYESVVRDISMWLPKVKHGGIIAGDDYGGHFTGVKQAVSEFFPKHEIYCGNQWVARKP